MTGDVARPFDLARLCAGTESFFAGVAVVAGAGPMGTPVPGSRRPTSRRTHVAGRVAAAAALRRLTGRAVWLGRNPGGPPPWPAGVAGSLSHSPHLALCVVAHGPVALGLDVEPLSSAHHLTAGAHYFAAAPERARLGPDDPLAALRLFSAKEAAYKAFPPAVQRRLSLLQVRLREVGGGSGAVPSALFRTDRTDLPPLTIRVGVLAGHVVAAAVGPPATIASVADTRERSTADLGTISGGAGSHSSPVVVNDR